MSRVAHGGLLLLFAAVALLSSCRREAPSNIDRNQAPETYIIRAPAESSLTYYRTRFYWGGSDPDGQIAYYEFAVTDSNEFPGEIVEEGTGYTRTLATDSLFVLSTERPVEQQIIGKRLYVRAVDNEGKVDPTPAIAYFRAKNDFYPEVIFKPGTCADDDGIGSHGRWTDRCGTAHCQILTSTDEFDPTDTVGVGPTGVGTPVRWRWCGRDGDAEGSIRGFEYKLSSQPSYRGGTLADTMATFVFHRNSGRRQFLNVKAVDDGGLRSQNDFVASVVYNFDPLTWTVFHPSIMTNPDGTPKAGSVYLVGTQLYESGVTLADTRREVDVIFTGIDDSRDWKPSCDDPGITSYEARTLYREDEHLQEALSPWGPATGKEPFPGANTLSLHNLGSGDHRIQIRARDDLFDFDSTPAEVVVRINYRPYLTRFTVRPETAPLSADVDLLNYRYSSTTDPGPLISLIRDMNPKEEGDQPERLLVTLLGSDWHKASPMASGGGPRDSLAALYDPNDVIEDELHLSVNATEAYRAFLDGIQSPGFDPDPDPSPADQVFVPYATRVEVPGSGRFTLRGDVRDRNFSSPTTGRTTLVPRRIQVQFVLTGKR